MCSPAPEPPPPAPHISLKALQGHGGGGVSTPASLALPSWTRGPPAPPQRGHGPCATCATLCRLCHLCGLWAALPAAALWFGDGVRAQMWLPVPPLGHLENLSPVSVAAQGLPTAGDGLRAAAGPESQPCRPGQRRGQRTRLCTPVLSGRGFESRERRPESPRRESSASCTRTRSS